MHRLKPDCHSFSDISASHLSNYYFFLTIFTKMEKPQKNINAWGSISQPPSLKYIFYLKSVKITRPH